MHPPFTRRIMPALVALCLTATVGALVAADAYDYVTENAMAELWQAAPRPSLSVPHLAEGATIDGMVDDDVWQRASMVSGFINRRSTTWHGEGGGQHSIVTGYSLAAAQTKTWIYRTDDALYVAYRCEEPEIESLALERGKGRDGSLWNNDCIELFLSVPDGPWFQFIVDPKGDVFDSRNGDRGWNMANVDTHIATAVHIAEEDLVRSTWTVELKLPFAGLGVTPKDGDVWTGNFARERRAPGYKAYHEINTWTGTIQSFGDAQHYGKLAFSPVAVQLPAVTDAPIGGMNTGNTNQGRENPFLGRNTAIGTLLNNGAEPATATCTVTVTNETGTEELASRSVSLPPGQPQPIEFPYVLANEGAGYVALQVAVGDTVVGTGRRGFRSERIDAALDRGIGNARELQRRADPTSTFSVSVAPHIEALEKLRADSAAAKEGILAQPASPESRTRWRELWNAVQKAMSGGNYVLWTCSPSLPVGPSTYPDTIESVDSIDVNTCVNEYENAVVNISNLTGESMDFYVRGNIPMAASNPRGGFPYAVRTILQNHGGEMRGFGDPKNVDAEDNGLSMPLLDLGPHPVVHVPPYSTRQVWFTTHTRDAGPTIKATGKPGRPYSATVMFVPVSHETMAGRGIALHVHVYGFEIADVADLGTFAWNYSLPLDFMLRYKFNTFFGSALPPPQKGKDGKWTITPEARRYEPVLARGDRFRFIIGYGFVGSYNQWAEKQGLAYMSEEWKATLQDFFRQFVTGLKEIGLAYDRFVVQSIDECHGSQVKQLAAAIPLLRDVDPNVRWMMTIMASPAELKAMAPYTDVWMNRNGKHWNIDFLKAEQARGKPLYSWHMSGDTRSEVLSWTRTYGWRAEKWGFDNISYFVFSASVYDYQKEEPVAGRMIEAWRDTIEDWQYFHELRKAIAAARERGADETAIRDAEALIDDVLTNVLEHEDKKPGNPFFPSETQGTADEIERARTRLAEAILRIRTLRTRN